MDPVKRNILEVALAEFANYGLEGSRIESIAAGTRTSKRMIYYHFGSKEGLYAAVLEFAYRMVRENEDMAYLEQLPPLQALERFAGYAFDNFSRYPDFIRLTLQENLRGARFVREQPEIKRVNRAGVEVVQRLLERGQADGSIRAGITALDTYITFVGLCAYQVSARPSYQALFDVDFFEPEMAARRRAAICDALVRYARV